MQGVLIDLPVAKLELSDVVHDPITQLLHADFDSRFQIAFQLRGQIGKLAMNFLDLSRIRFEA